MTIQVHAAPALSANGKIAFTSDRDGNYEIYLMNPDGSGQTRLTSNSVRDDYPTWSPDGRTIAFIRQNGSVFSLNLMNADGANVRQITTLTLNSNLPYPYERFGMNWSPNGAKIAFQDSGDIFTIDVDGGNRTNLTNGQFINYAPSWSPDGLRIAFARSIYSHGFYHEVYTMNSDGSNVEQITTTPSYSDSTMPDWSPDGERITLGAGADMADSESLALIDPNGANLRYILLNYNFPDYINKPKWSPDGTKIVFYGSGYSNHISQIWVINRDGGGLGQLTSASPNNFNPDWQPVTPSRTAFDFDGDGRADLSVFRPSDQTWYLNRDSGGFNAARFGLAADKPVPADFDGDGRTDIAVFRDGIWYWLNSSNNRFNAFQFGLAGDIPQPADFDGDGKAEITVYRQSPGYFYVFNLATNQFTYSHLEISSGYPSKPIVGDYDGDGRADYAVYGFDGLDQPEWQFRYSSGGSGFVLFGGYFDKPVPADYDGDGKTDLAVFTPSTGDWYIWRSATNDYTTVNWGLAADVLVPADYDGDGKADIAVFRDGVWWIRRRTGGVSVQQFGLSNDKPVPSAYLP